MNLTLIASSIGDAIKNWFQGWFGAVLSFIPKIFYQLLTPLWAILDAMQWIMRKLAGLDTIASFEGSKDFSGDLVNYFINAIFSGDSPVLANVFWSMIILGALMLIITTFIAVIKSEYTATDAKSASKGKIIGNAFKAIASFAIVPIVCFFGIFICNVILQAVDKITANPTSLDGEYVAKFKPSSVTSGIFNDKHETGQQTYYHYSFFGYKVPSTNTPISGIIFRTAAYNANRARSDGHFYEVMLENEKVNAGGVFNIKNGTDDASKDYNTNIIDEAFANCYRLTENQQIDRKPFKYGHMFPVTLNAGVMIYENILINEGYEYFDKNNVALVWYYYDLWSFDLIVAIGSLVVVFISFIHILLGLIKRIFELVLLFLISAPMASLMPLDGGNALKKWREKFISKAIGVYGPVVGMNIFFIILGVLQSLKLTGIDIIDRVVYLLFVIAGLTMVKDFTAMLSELIGGEDTMKAGADKAKEVGAMAKNVGTKAAAFGGLAGKVAFAGIKATKGIATSVSKNFKKHRARKGKGRYEEGSRSWNNAVDNMADSVDLGDDDGVSALISTKNYGENAFMNITEGMSSDNWSKWAKKLGHPGLDNNKENRQKLWNSLSEAEKSTFAKDVAKLELDGLDPEERRKKVAAYRLDSMDWKDRQDIIDANYRTRGQHNRIRNRAEKAAKAMGKDYSSLSASEQAELFNQSRHGNFDNKLTRTAERIGNGLAGNSFGLSSNRAHKYTINGEKIEIGKEASKGLGEAFKNFGKQAGSFVQHMFDGLSGNLGEGMKGTGNSMLAAFQGKLKKEIAVQEEKKNQKKVMSAQRAAQAELDGKGAARQEREPRIPKKDKIELSEASIRAMERAVENANKSSAEKTTFAMTEVKNSIDALTSALKDKSKKS